MLLHCSVPIEVVDLNFSSDPSCLLERSVARIRCETRGYPEPVITFFKGASPISFNDRIMLAACDEIVINEVEQTDEGLYTCVATNPANELSATHHSDAQLDYCSEYARIAVFNVTAV